MGGIGRPKGRIWFFSAAAVLAAILLSFAATELIARAIGIRTSDDPYIQFGFVPSFFEKVEKDNEPHWKIVHRDLYRERNVTFRQEKEPGTFRIFCVGGSASAGWPHPAGEVYSAYLERELKRAYPGRPIEVINVSAHAYAAYRVRMVLQEIIEYDPDLIIIYSGNNEFIEQRNYATSAHWYDPLASAANGSVTYKLLRGSILGRRLFPDSTLSDRGRGDTDRDQWSKILQLPLELRRNPQQFEHVKTHYEFSIRSMVEIAGGQGTPVVLLTVPVNLRDWQPNVSAHAVEEPGLCEWSADFNAGRAALIRGEHPAAVDHLRKAAAADPGHAASHYYLARALEANEMLPEALEQYLLARDLDMNPFRALSAFNDIVRKTAARHHHVELVDADKALLAATTPLAPGFDLMLDYVHPSVRGNEIIAEQVFNAIVRREYIGPAPGGFKYQAKASRYLEGSDYGMQKTLLLLYAMMHQYETAARVARYLVEADGALDVLGEKDAGAVRDVYEVFPALVDLERSELLGEDVSAEERSSIRTKLDRFYRSIWGDPDNTELDLPQGRAGPQG